MSETKCSTPFCREAPTKAWGIDRRPVCAACYAEIDQTLAALLIETGATNEPTTEEA